VTYRIIIERRAQKEAEKIPSKHRAAIDKTILSLSHNPRSQKSVKLTDREGYRVRVGDYRILYSIYDEAGIVVVYRIRTRGKSTYR
jgi:mRNA interferase RelE/StbE